MRLAEPHAALGNFLRETWDWAGAEREYQRALALNPSLAGAHRNFGGFWALWGGTTRPSPRNTCPGARPPEPFAGTVIGYRLFWARRYDDAIEMLKRELDRELPLTTTVLGYTYAAKGMHKEAIAAYRARD